MKKHCQCFVALVAVLFLFSAGNAQRAEVTISLNEAFFDAMIDSVYQNYDPPEFSIAKMDFSRIDTDSHNSNTDGLFASAYAFAGSSQSVENERPFCTESIKILRESGGVRTAVRFRDGKLYVPMAFSGGYAPPFIGCVDFSGWAETNIDLEFDRDGQRLIGRAHVANVNLNGTGGVGGTLIAKMLQNTIDKKLNPIEILRLDKVSFGIPIQNTGNIKMKATGIRPEISNGSLNIHIDYEFLKG